MCGIQVICHLLCTGKSKTAYITPGFREGLIEREREVGRIIDLCATDNDIRNIESSFDGGLIKR